MQEWSGKHPAGFSRTVYSATTIAAFVLLLHGCATNQPPAVVVPVASVPSPPPVLRAVIPLIPEMSTPEDGFDLAMDAFKVGDMETASFLARGVMERYPDTPWGRRALFLRGRAYLAQDLIAEAQKDLLASAAGYPELADYALFTLAEYLYAKGDHASAINLYQRLISSYPASQLAARAALRRAQALYESGCYADAANAFEKVLSEFPRSEFAAEAGLALGRSCAEARDLDRAVRAFLDVSVKYPKNGNDAEVERALSGLKLLGAAVPKLTSDEWYERARNLFRAGQYDKAQESFSKALEANPTHPQRADILLKSGIALFNLGRRPEAASLLERLLKARLPDCRCDEAMNWLGKSYSRLGLREEALEVFQRLVKTYPDSDWADDALYLSGNSYREASDHKHAVRAYQQLVSQYPESSLADSSIWWQGWEYYTVGEYRKAAQAFQDLVKRYPRSWLVNQALYWQGRAAERSGDTGKAVSFYGKVLTRGPYTYYGYRAADRMMAVGFPVIAMADDPAVPAPAPHEYTESADNAQEQAAVDENPRVWTREVMKALSEDPSYRKILELVYLGMKREAASELWSLQERTPARHGSLLGLSKAFFEMGDYHRSLMIVLRNFDRYLERPSESVPEDIWLLAYPQGFWDSVVTHARKYDLDPYFVAAIIREESQFQPEALSPAGARGVMQVMPATGEWVARMANIPAFNRSRLFEPDTVINIGAWYLSHLMKRFRGDVLLVIAAYNAGPEAVAGWLDREGNAQEQDAFVESIPYSETRGYVKKVLRNFAEYKRIYGKGGTTLPASLPRTPVREGQIAKPDPLLLCGALRECP